MRNRDLNFSLPLYFVVMLLLFDWLWMVGMSFNYYFQRRKNIYLKTSFKPQRTWREEWRSKCAFENPIKSYILPFHEATLSTNPRSAIFLFHSVFMITEGWSTTSRLSLKAFIVFWQVLISVLYIHYWSCIKLSSLL